MNDPNWRCPKCQNESFETAEIRASGGAFSAMMDVANKRFTTVTCERCAYTEMYKTKVSGLGKVLEVIGSV